MSATATAPAPAAPADADGSTATPRPRRRLLLVAVAVAALTAAATAAWFLLLRPGDAAGDAPTDDAPAAVVEGPVVEVGTLTTNLAGSSARYARVGLALVLTADADPVAVESRFPLVKDAAIGEIGRHEAASLQADGGTQRLRDGLAERIRAVYPDGEVVRVVLTELLVQ